jgi:hypothetical protein
MSTILHRLIRDRKIIPSKTSLGMVLKEMEGGREIGSLGGGGVS